jgi:hypothetical protein
VCVDANGNTNCPRKSKIGKLYCAVIIDEQILRFQITMNNATLMTEADTLTNLK